MSIKKPELSGEAHIAYQPQVDTRQQDSSRRLEEKQRLSPIAYPDDEEEQKFRRYNTDFMTYQTIRSETKQENWGMVVRIVSSVLIIYSVLSFVLDVLGLFYSLFLHDSSHSFSFMDQETLVFIGMSDTAMKILSLVADIMIFVQGFIGLRTVGKNSKGAIKQLINLTILFMLVHVVIVITKLVISASYIDNYNWRSAKGEEHVSEEEIEKMETFVYGLILATFFLS